MSHNSAQKLPSASQKRTRDAPKPKGGNAFLGFYEQIGKFEIRALLEQKLWTGAGSDQNCDDGSCRSASNFGKIDSKLAAESSKAAVAAVRLM